MESLYDYITSKGLPYPRAVGFHLDMIVSGHYLFRRVPVEPLIYEILKSRSDSKSKSV